MHGDRVASRCAVEIELPWGWLRVRKVRLFAIGCGPDEAMLVGFDFEGQEIVVLHRLDRAPTVPLDEQLSPAPRVGEKRGNDFAIYAERRHLVDAEERMFR